MAGCILGIRVDGIHSDEAEYVAVDVRDMAYEEVGDQREGTNRAGAAAALATPRGQGHLVQTRILSLTTLPDFT